MKVGSLFTGAGGLDLAIQRLWPDAELAWWCEYDTAAAASFSRHTDAPNLVDVTTVDWTQVEPVDVLVGGFPCQDLSQAGARAGLSGDRSGLWFHMLNAANILKPRWLLAENVPGIYTADGGSHDDMDMDRDVLDGRAARPARALDTVLGSLAEDGWDAEWCNLRAGDVGAPHRRDRWFLVAWSASDSDGAGSQGRPGDGHTEHAAGVRAGHGWEGAAPADAFWGEYADAIARWEYVTGVVAPQPTDDQGRLSPDFTEWMMGWPQGWTTGTRAARLKQCGNGVVPLQAATAYARLMDRVVS